MMKNIAGKRAASGLTAALLVVMLVLELLPLSIYAADEQTSAPKAENCVVYKNKIADAEEPDWDNYELKVSTGIVPTLYMWNYGREATLRVYNAASGGQLMGTGTYNEDSHYWAVPLETEKKDWYGDSNYGSFVYVTLQESGKTESERVAVAYPERIASVSFEVVGLVDKAADGSALLSDSSKNMIDRAGTPSRLKAGKYYVVDIVMNNFTKVQSITLPIKYDPEIFELTSLSETTIGGERGYKIGSAVKTGEAGVRLPFVRVVDLQDRGYVIGGNPAYGIGTYRDLYNWGVQQGNSGGSSEAQTPYVNTETGLIKLEFSDEMNVADLSNLVDKGPSGGVSKSTSRKTVRLYFKCKKAFSGPSDTAWGDQEAPLHFATSADVPEGVTDRNIAQRYYNLVSPNGYRASIQAINLLTTPLSAKYIEDGSCDIIFAAGELAREDGLTKPYNERIKELIQNTVKVYNYSNSHGDASDTDDSAMTDVFILTPSKDAGAAKEGDKISIYTQQGGSYVKIVDSYEVGANGDGEYGAIIDLGTDKLDAAGGSVYVSVTRGLNGESAKIEVPYSAEMSRDIYFDLNSTGYTNEYAQNKFLEDYQVKAGDQLRLDIYFNNFSDLLAYTFKINFNSSVLKAADRNFDALADGPSDKGVYISQSDFNDGKTCIEPGADLADAPTFNESLAMAAYREYKAGKSTADEAMAIMQEQLPDMAITSTNDMDAVAGELAAKYPFGSDEAFWDGGLTFNPFFPHYNNYTGEVTFQSARLKFPPLELSKSDYGTHGYHFVSVYFVATSSGEAGLSIDKGTTRDYGAGVEKVFNGGGTTDIVFAGPGYERAFTASNVCSLPFMTHWSVSGMAAIEKSPTLRLTNGNKDATSDDVYLYEGYPFRDPGFLARDSKGLTIVNTGSQTEDTAHVVKREVSFTDNEDNTTTFSLDPWKNDEEILDFVIPDGMFSAHYTIKYTYTEPADPSDPESTEKTAEATREVYVIRQKGDYNGDGGANVFDLLFDLEGSGARSDSNFTNYTLAEEPDNLDLLVDTILKKYTDGNEPLFDLVFTPPVPKPAAEPDGEGSTDPASTKYSIEFYAADADPDASPTPLDPTNLPAGQEVIMAVKAENITAVCPDGMVNIAFGIKYDSDKFTLMGFDEDLGDGCKGMAEGSAADETNDKWVSALESLYGDAKPEISVKASDIPLDESHRRVYIHYVDSLAINPIWINDTGYLAAFKFKVGNETFTDAPFEWLDYGLAVDEGGDELTRLNRHTLLNGTTPFQKPQDVNTSATATEVVGYTITGEVVSYNAKNPVTYELYKMGDDNEHQTMIEYSTGVLVEAETGDTAGQHTQGFEITGVENGSYRLVLKKTSHVDFTINNIIILDANINLGDYIGSCEMGAGDMNGDGYITAGDGNLVTLPSNFGKSIESAGVDATADMNGDGSVTAGDGNIVTLPKYFGFGANHFEVAIDYSKKS